METPFSRMLVQFRKKAGFPTAYRFYHGNGGRAVFNITYRRYLLIEQGKNLPRLNRLDTFTAAMRLASHPADEKALTTAWLQTMVGEKNFNTHIAPLLAAPEPPAAQSVVQRILDSKTHYLSLTQAETICSDQDTRLCWFAISNDTGLWPLEDAAARLKLTVTRTEEAFKKLAKAKLIKEVKKGVYKCPVSHMFCQGPQVRILHPALFRKLCDLDNKLAETGAEIFIKRIVTRADEPDMRNFFTTLGTTISTAAAYAVTEKTEKSALFMVEGKVIRLRSF